MKTIKFIISFCVLFIGMLIIGESHTFHLENFYTKFDQTTLYMQPHTTDQEMVKDILNSAKNNDVEVFTYIKSPKSMFSTEFEVYGSSGVEPYINKELQIHEEVYESLFMGNIRFSFSELDKIGEMDAVHEFYVIGNDDQVHAFKMNLIDKYAGNHPQEGYENTELRNTIILIWLLILCMILFLTFYDAIFTKKESLIKISMGESVHKIFWENVMIDSIVLTVHFSIVVSALSQFTSVWFRFDLSLTFFLLMLFLNSLLYLSLFNYPIKEVFSNSVGSKKLLTLNYSLKIFTSIITILIVSSNLVFIVESFNLYKQKSFFEEYSEYDYIRLQYKPVPNRDGSATNTLTDSVNVQMSFYQAFFREFKATSFVNISNLTKVEGILANQNSYAYLSSKIKELREAALAEKVYFVLPKGLSNDAGIVKKMMEAVHFYEGADFSYDHEVIYYEDPIELISIDENYTYGSDFFENPVIIYNNLTPKMLTAGSNNIQKMNVLHDIMYKIEDQAFTRFIEEHGLENQIVSRTNALENYENKWTIAKRVLYINLVFSVLVIVMELLIISSIIKLEYDINAIELAIKKVMGYSAVEKHRKLLVLTVLTTTLSMGLTVIISFMLNFGEFYYLMIGGISILLLEVAVILFFIHRIEKAKIQKILKGGNL
ncbi:DUF1430 domain-containing protein [Paenibacillus algorifonticola]|uniref:DUF1430 domain-containing protein n=1 Tax=Paenibacillus algorifonticola TaxID=684063 RepID=UPI003D29B1CF